MRRGSFPRVRGSYLRSLGFHFLLTVSFCRMNLLFRDASYADPDIIEVSSSWASSSLSASQKRKRSQVVPRDIIEIDDDDNDTDEVMIIGEKISDKKKKQPMKYEKGSSNQVKFSQDLFPVANGSSFIELKSEKDVSLDKLKGLVLEPLDFSFEDYDYTEFDNDDYEDDDDEYSYDMAAFENDKNNFSLTAQFDNLDLPPGVEASVPWLSSDVSRMPVAKRNPFDDEIEVKFKAFKQFDTARDSTDHYFHRPELLKITPSGKKTGNGWAKKVQQEWKVLEKDLPDRMDLLRAVIIGPDGTPYHDGLFFFDIYFPPTYPLVPPMVHYLSGGLRLNPNLYACGKVCLSLLNTWTGHGCEKWDPKNSTMLQVLISIQALVLNAKPYFNEPGYASSATTPHGKVKSLAYNEDIFILSCKTMLYSLRRPPKHFEDFVAGHFRNNGRKILMACRAYSNGAQVGCVVGDGVQDVDEGDKSSSQAFKRNLSAIFDLLQMEFAVKGADCRVFLTQKANDGATGTISKAASVNWHHI